MPRCCRRWRRCFVVYACRLINQQDSHVMNISLKSARNTGSTWTWKKADGGVPSVKGRIRCRWKRSDEALANFSQVTVFCVTVARSPGSSAVSTAKAFPCDLSITSRLFHSPLYLYARHCPLLLYAHLVVPLSLYCYRRTTRAHSTEEDYGNDLSIWHQRATYGNIITYQ